MPPACDSTQREARVLAGHQGCRPTVDRITTAVARGLLPPLLEESYMSDQNVGSAMRAVVFTDFGGPEVLVPMTVPRPEPLPTEVLVRVHAAGINPLDLRTRAGFPTPPGRPSERGRTSWAGTFRAQWWGPVRVSSSTRPATRSSACSGCPGPPAPTRSTSPRPHGSLLGSPRASTTTTPPHCPSPG